MIQAVKLKRMPRSAPAKSSSPTPPEPRSELVAQLARRIADDLREEGAVAGTHVRTQTLADQHRVSRFPINEALHLLAGQGVLIHQPNRGFFVAEEIPLALPDTTPASDELTSLYFQIAEDRLRGQLPDQVSQTFLKDRYHLTGGQLHQLISRIIEEGWLERRPGYGLEFTPMLTTPEALNQTYQFRAALEPNSLLQPGYFLDPALAARCRRVEEHLLGGGLENMTTQELYDRGVSFHETIVGASQNPFFVDALRKINRVRRLLAYRSTQDRRRYIQQSEEHLEILELLEQQRNLEAARRLEQHLGNVIRNLDAIRPILEN